MYACDFETGQEILAHWVIIEEVDDTIAEHMFVVARRRGHHDQRRRNAHRYDGPHEWYPRPESHRVEEARDTCRATRAALVEMRQEAEVGDPGLITDDEPMDFGDDVYVCSGAAIYDPPNEEDEYDWYGSLSPDWAENSIL